MKLLDIWIVSCVFVGLIKVCPAKRGFILTSPKMIDAGGTEHFTFTAFDVPPGGQATVKLLQGHTEEVLAETKVLLHNYNMWVEMNVPPASSNMTATLKVEAAFSDGSRMEASNEVFIRHNSIVTFVQTDKPLYKPGQTVRFRILPTDSQLKPVGENTEADIWIEDPSGIRVAQWRQITFAEGIKQLELPLSTEPTLGTWSIKTLINQVTNTQKFNVEKYVLPKFDVKIKPPPYVMADAETFTVEICAWYTYGKKVNGVLTANASYKRYVWEDKQRPIPSVEHTGQISGCHNFVVNTQDILLQTREFGYRTIQLLAEVVENGTEISANASATLEITHSPLHMKFLGSEGETDYFKPGIPFYGELYVEKPDGSPAPSEKIQICTEFKYFSSDSIFTNQRSISKCQHFTSDRKGRVHFSVAPKAPTISKIIIVAEAVNHHPQRYRSDTWQEKIERPRASLDLVPWYSATHSHLQIQPLPDVVECEKLQRVKVFYTTEKGTAIKFYHQVLSRGRIVQQGSHQRTFFTTEEDEEVRYDLGEVSASDWSDYADQKNDSSDQPPDLGQFVLNFFPRATMSPVARLLVFYVRDDGEVVADSRKFRIQNCLLNKVDMHFRHERQVPGSDASLMLTASPASSCGVGMVDKSVHLLRHQEQFKKDMVFKVMESYDVGKKHHPQQVTKDYCMLKGINDINAPLGLQQNHIGMGFNPLSRRVSMHADTIMAFEEAGVVVISNLNLETRPCVISHPIAIAYNLPDRARLPGMPGPHHGVYGYSSIHGMHRVRASQKPVLNLKTKKEEVPKADVEIRNFFPETWLWEMHTVGSSGELAIKRKLPHTITEWVGGAVCIHPKTGLGLSESATITAFQPFFLALQLPYSVIRGEKLPLKVTVFNYLSECLPIKLSLEPKDEYKIESEARYHKLCVCGGQSETHRFTIRPTTLGFINITVYGHSLEDDDDICENEVTARLSARDAVSRQLLVEAEGFPKEEVFNYYVCPENNNGTYQAEVDLLLPEDVIEDSSRAYVSVSGDLMGPSLSGLRNLVKLPVGCGEQNMVLFVPNIFVLDYLGATSQVTPDIQAECLDNMKTGYQRELQYRHSDGSYSAFGPKDNQGSLWLSAFVLKSFGQARRFVSVDEHDLRLTTSWILEKQFENGCFEPTGFLLNKAMKGGLTDGDGSLAPLAAYVLIALLESGVQRPDQPPMKLGMECLRNDPNPTSYSLSLYAYAHALAKDTEATLNYLRRMESKAINTGTYLYWESTSGDSVSVETAGYYILAQIELHGKDSSADVLPAVRWITQQRNSNGGFISTQDTVVALQALARYASLQSQGDLELDIIMDSDDLTKAFSLNNKNRLLSQTDSIQVLPNVVDVKATGKGCGLVQFSLRYNVGKVSAGEAFDLNIDTKRTTKIGCPMITISLCMRYKIRDQVSNMVVLSVKMASGFSPDEKSINMIQNTVKVQLKRYEIVNNHVNFYFDELTNEQKCFRFEVKSDMDVEEIKPSSVKLYDYYQPELQITQEYTIPADCMDVVDFDYPLLPPVLIDTDIDQEYDIFNVPETTTMKGDDERTSTDYWNETLESVPFSTSETITISFAENETEIVNMFSPTVLEITPTTSFFEYTTPTSNEFTYEDLSTTTMMLSTLPENATESYSESAENDTMNLNNMELSDDAMILDGNERHIQNFVDVDHELDLPDGLEGNIPVSVLPPTLSEIDIREVESEHKNENCPVCLDDLPENFTDIYCYSAFALRISVREGKTYPKILQDVSAYLDEPKSIKKFSSLHYNHSCICQQLHEPNILIVIGNQIDLWNSEKDKHRIHLTNEVYVISSPAKTIQLARLRNEQTACKIDP